MKKTNYYIIVGLIFLLGVFIRLKGLLVNPSLWHDECALAINVLTKPYTGLFGGLEYEQSAPPFFLLATKLLITFLDAQKSVFYCDLALRIIPFIFSIFSILLFLPFAKTITKNKTVIYISFFLFATNFYLASYSVEFKQYTVDLFFAMLITMISLKVDFENINYKKLFLAGSLTALSIWCSSSSIIITLTSITYLMLKNRNILKAKKFYLFLAPIVFSSLLFLFLSLIPSINANFTNLNEYWLNNFLSLNLKNDYFLIKALTLAFARTKLYIVAILFFIYSFFKLKNENRNCFIYSIILTTYISFFSICKLYPISPRLLLFTLPLIILIYCIPLIKISKKTYILAIIILLTTYNSTAIGKNLPIKAISREMFEILATKSNTTDKIFVNKLSDTDFKYYNTFYKLKNETVQENLKNPTKEEYIRYLNSLPKGTYVFYLAFTQKTLPLLDVVKEWSNQQKNPELIIKVKKE